MPVKAGDNNYIHRVIVRVRQDFKLVSDRGKYKSVYILIILGEMSIIGRENVLLNIHISKQKLFRKVSHAKVSE